MTPANSIDDDPVDRRRHDLLSAAGEVCRLHWAMDAYTHADIRELRTVHDGRELGFIRASYARDGITRHELVGVHDGPASVAVVEEFAALFADHGDVQGIPFLVVGEEPTYDVRVRASQNRMDVFSFDTYVDLLWNHAGYVRDQTERLVRDGVYPLDKHVDKRWALLGHPPREATAAEQILRWMETDGPRFVLVLGDFGTGKTFLVRVLAQRLAEHKRLVPVLVTMRDLEQGRTLDELLAQHMARYRPDDPFHARSFRYLLREGRVALLFDGFDELAQRPTYDRVRQHFDTLRQAAEGNAKIVVTSRHEHFATDAGVLNELGRHVRGMPGARIIRLFPLDDDQRRGLAKQTFDDGNAAESFLRDLESVPNLPELAANPRMLTFMMARRDSLARLSEPGPSTTPVTAGRLYEVLLTDWLEHEVRRQTVRGAAEPLSVDQRRAAVRTLAVLLWLTGQESVSLVELGELAKGITGLATWQVQSGEAAHAVGTGTVLVRTAEGRFAFIHQSVMEWFVADHLRLALRGSGPSGADRILADHALSHLMVDFLGDLGGRDSAVAWARGVVARADGFGPKAKANAVLILQRTGTRLLDPHTAHYAGQDLRGRDLSGQNLVGADLSGALLEGAVLPSDLTRTNLRAACLAGARLDGADLTGADLRGADLRGARLTGANLTGAQLEGTRLERAVLLGARLDEAALASASTFGAALPDMVPTPQFGGAAEVTAMLAVRDGALLATGHEDGTVRLWEVASGRCLRVFRAHHGAVTAFGADSGGAWLVSAGDDGRVRLWDPVTGAPLRTLDGHRSSVRALAVHPDGWFASAGDDQRINIWDAATGALLRTVERPGRTYALAVDPQGGWLASATYADVRLYEPASGTLLTTLRERVLHVDDQALAVGPNGGWLASTSRDAVHLSQPRTGKRLWELSTNGPVRALAGDRHCAWLAAATGDGVQIWDPSNSELLRTLVSDNGSVRVLAADPNGAWLAAADRARVRLWDPATGVPIGSLSSEGASVSSLTVDPSGQWFGAKSVGGRVQLWDPVAGSRLRTMVTRSVASPALTADPRGSWLASTSAGHKLQLWDLTTGGQGRELKINVGRLSALVVDPRGMWLAGGGEDHAVRIWDPATGQLVRTIHGQKDSVRALAVDPEGRWLASAGDDRQVKFWNARPLLPYRRWSLRRTLNGGTGRVLALAVHPAGTWLASGSTDRMVRLWDPTTGQLLHTLEGHLGGVRALTVDPGGVWLASGASDGTVHLWSATTGAPLGTLEAHTGRVQALAVHPAGAWLLSAGNDGTVRVWDPSSWELLATCVEDENGWAFLRPDGEYRVVGAPRAVWWTAGLCRFDSDEIDEIAQYVPALRPLSEGEPCDHGE